MNNLMKCVVGVSATAFISATPAHAGGYRHHHGNPNWWVAPIIAGAMLGTAAAVATAPLYAPPAPPYATGYPTYPYGGYGSYRAPYTGYGSASAYPGPSGYSSASPYDTRYGSGYPTNLHPGSPQLCQNSQGWSTPC